MLLNEIQATIDAYRALEKKVKTLGLERIKAAYPKSQFPRYLLFKSFYVEESKVVAEFDFSDEAPYSGCEEVTFTAEELS